MLLVPLRSESLEALGAELASSAIERDRDAEFNRAIFDLIFLNQSFPRLDFTSRESHRRSTLKLIEALQTIGRASLDLPFIASVAAQAAIAPEIVARFASDELKTKHLARIQSGADLTAICNSEESGGTQLKTMTSRCVIASDGTAVLNVQKPIATNAFSSKNVLVSAWEQRPNQVPSLQMYLVEASQTSTSSVVGQLTGFRTGNCGALTITDSEIDVEASRLGSDAPSMATFRHCFDFERFYLAALVIGVIDGLETLMLENLKKRSNLLDKQFVQEKAIALTVVRAKLQSLFSTVVARGLDSLHESQVELSILKWICAEEAPLAVQKAAEIGGWNSLRGDDTFNRVGRDLSALRFFGGTVELQKMTIFSTVMGRKGSNG